MKTPPTICILFTVMTVNRLKELRETRGMKQIELASLLCVEQQTISRYESGVRDMSPDTIARVCRIFGCTADYLLGLSSRREPEISALDAQLLAAYHMAPPEIRRIVDTALDPYTEKKEAAAG